MNRGELSGDTAINLVFRELDYQCKVKGSDKFIYDFTNKIAHQYLSRDDQEQILHTLFNKGLIKLKVETASNDLESLTGDDLHIIDLYLVDVTDTLWPQVDINNAKKVGQHTARLILEDAHLRVELDTDTIITIRGFQDTNTPSDPHKLFIHIFNSRIGEIHRLSDIFPNYSSLTKVVKDAKLGYLLPIFFTGRGSKELQLLEMPIEISNESYELLLSKSKEKQGKV